jgi:hypothetical protein
MALPKERKGRMTKDEALDLALEAFETKSFDLHSEWGGPFNGEDKLRELRNKAITAIKQARALDKMAENARELGLDYEPVAEFKSPQKRWEDGDDHDPRSETIYKYISDMDFKHCGDSFCFKSGGDGDNGETLMFILDCWFAQHHTTPPAAPVQEPVANDWSVFNTGGAEVWGGLSLADAVAELTPDRLERGWSAVCVINKDNPPIYTTPPAAQRQCEDEK